MYVAALCPANLRIPHHNQGSRFKLSGTSMRAAPTFGADDGLAMVSLLYIKRLAGAVFDVKYAVLKKCQHSDWLCGCSAHWCACQFAAISLHERHGIALRAARCRPAVETTML